MGRGSLGRAYGSSRSRSSLGCKPREILHGLITWHSRPRMRALVLLLVAACESGTAAPPPKQKLGSAAPIADADPGTLDAAHLYATFCAQCHGGDAKGYKADHAPSLVNPTFLES